MESTDDCQYEAPRALLRTIAHSVPGRLRIRVRCPLPEGTLAQVALAVTQHSGVTSARVNERCGSIVIRYDPGVVGVPQLVARVDHGLARVGATDMHDRSVAAAPANAASLRVLLEFALALLDPPGIGLVRDVVRAAGIVSVAVNELRTQPWHRVVLRAAWRLLCECSSIDALFPRGVRIALRLVRRAFSVRRLLARVGMHTLAPLATPALAAAA